LVVIISKEFPEVKMLSKPHVIHKRKRIYNRHEKLCARNQDMLLSEPHLTTNGVTNKETMEGTPVKLVTLHNGCCEILLSNMTRNINGLNTSTKRQNYWMDSHTKLTSILFPGNSVCL
jgi:Golgi nucleoside diphosphatase